MISRTLVTKSSRAANFAAVRRLHIETAAVKWAAKARRRKLCSCLRTTSSSATCEDNSVCDTCRIGSNKLHRIICNRQSALHARTRLIYWSRSEMVRVGIGGAGSKASWRGGIWRTVTPAPEKKAELVGNFEGEFCWQINVGGYTLVSVSHVLEF